MEPIRHEYQLHCDPERAFSIYTARIGDWWHPDYTRDAATLERVTIEPMHGGRVYAAHRDTGDDEWGRITVWDPPHRLVHTATLGGVPSEITVTFAKSDAGCSFRFEHAVENRAKFTDWPKILDRFAALCNLPSP